MSLTVLLDDLWDHILPSAWRWQSTGWLGVVRKNIKKPKGIENGWFQDVSSLKGWEKKGGMLGFWLVGIFASQSLGIRRKRSLIWCALAFHVCCKAFQQVSASCVHLFCHRFNWFFFSSFLFMCFSWEGFQVIPDTAYTTPQFEAPKTSRFEFPGHTSVINLRVTGHKERHHPGVSGLKCLARRTPAAWPRKCRKVLVTFAHCDVQYRPVPCSSYSMTKALYTNTPLGQMSEWAGN